MSEETATTQTEPPPAATLAASMLRDDYQRLQGELQQLLRRKQENDQTRVQIDTAIVAQRGAIAYVEMVLGRMNGDGQTDN